MLSEEAGVFGKEDGKLPEKPDLKGVFFKVSVDKKYRKETSL